VRSTVLDVTTDRKDPSMRRHAHVLALFFLAPLVAEYFLGDFPIFLLPVVVVLAPMYGGGALLIREVTRRTGRGWPTMFMLALAFGVFQEGILIQSMFNRDYQHLGLLDKGFIPSLGTAFPWDVYVLSLHLLWSLTTPIAIVEESVRERRTTPWLGHKGLAITAGLFVLGWVITFGVTAASSHGFMAKPAQLGVCAVIVVLLVLVAFRLPKPRPEAAAHHTATAPATAPRPWVVLVAALVAGAVVQLAIGLPTVIDVVATLVAIAVMAVLVARWSRGAGWGTWHRFALAAGALLTYAWHGFLLGADGSGAGLIVYLISRIVAVIGVVWVLRLALHRIRGPREESATLPVWDRSAPSSS
jgi:hypothetical protein